MPTALTALGALVAFYVFPVLFAAAAISSGALHLDPIHPEVLPLWFLLTAQIVAYAPLATLLTVVLPKLAKRSLVELGLRPPSAFDLTVGLLGAVGMIVTIAIAGNLISMLTHRHDTELAVKLLLAVHGTGERIAFVLIAAVLAPLVEELGFRLFVFNALRRYAPLTVAALVSGAIFGIVHATSLSEIATVGIPLACGGVVLAYVYARSGNYWAPVISHVVFNATSVIAVLVFHVKA